MPQASTAFLIFISDIHLHWFHHTPLACTTSSYHALNTLVLTRFNPSRDNYESNKLNSPANPPYSNPDPALAHRPAAMDTDDNQAIQYLESLLGRALRIHTTDSRMFVGIFKCTDAVGVLPQWPKTLSVLISDCLSGPEHYPRKHLRIPLPHPINRASRRQHRTRNVGRGIREAT